MSYVFRDVDFAHTQARNFLVENKTALPVTAKEGQLVYIPVTKSLGLYTHDGWKLVGDIPGGSIGPDLLTPEVVQQLTQAFDDATAALALTNLNLQEAKDYADAQAAAAQTAAEALARAEAGAAIVSASAYADGIVTAEEEARIQQATDILNQAKADAQDKADAALTAAETFATTAATSAETAAKQYAEAEAAAQRVIAEAHADGLVTAEESARISDVNTKLATAKDYADGQAAAAQAAAEALANAAQASADEAADAAEAAQTVANTADTKATNAEITANSAASIAATAQTTANGKNTVHYATTEPSGTAHKVNDIWFKTDDGNKLHTWSGSDWLPFQFGGDAIADLAITNAQIADGTIDDAKISSLTAGKIVGGTIDGNVVNVINLNAGNITAGQIDADRINLNISGINMLQNTVYSLPSPAVTISDDDFPAATGEFADLSEKMRGWKYNAIGDRPAFVDGWFWNSKSAQYFSYQGVSMVSSVFYMLPNEQYTLSFYTSMYNSPVPEIHLVKEQTTDGPLHTHYSILYSPMVPGDEHYRVNTVSSEKVNPISVPIDGGTGSTQFMTLFSIETPVRKVITFTTPSDISSDTRFFLYIKDTRTSSITRTLLSRLQLEKGNKVTGWTQSDMVGKNLDISPSGIVATSNFTVGGEVRVGTVKIDGDNVLAFFDGATKVGGLTFGSRGLSLTISGLVSSENGYAFHDTRSVTSVPEELPRRALSLEFKYKKNIGNPPASATATYAHILNVAGWNTNEGSGGWPTQVSIGDGIAFRQATGATSWGPWRNVWHSGNLAGSNRTIKKDITRTDDDTNYALFKNLNVYDYNLINDYDALDSEALKNRSRERSYIGLITDEVPDFLTDKEQEYIKIYNLASLTVSALQKTIEKVEVLEKIILESEEIL